MADDAPAANGKPSGEQAQLVSLNDAAERLGVHYMTAYRYVRTGRMYAEKRSGKWWVTTDELASVIEEGTGPRTARAGPGAALITLEVEPFATRLVAGDAAGCWEVISAALRSGASPVEIHRHLFHAALDDIGLGWQHGRLSIADEHRATATAYRLLGQMTPLFRHRGRRRGTVILATVAGDPHSLPSALLSDMLSDRRFDVIDLGANTPSEPIIAMAATVDDLIGIGLCAVLDTAFPTLARQARQLRTALPEVMLVAGGPAGSLDIDGRLAAHVDVVSLTADEACDAFESALEGLVARA